VTAKYFGLLFDGDVASYKVNATFAYGSDSFASGNCGNLLHAFFPPFVDAPWVQSYGDMFGMRGDVAIAVQNVYIRVAVAVVGMQVYQSHLLYEEVCVKQIQDYCYCCNYY
jgi:hypothetical protein